MSKVFKSITTNKELTVGAGSLGKVTIQSESGTGTVQQILEFKTHDDSKGGGILWNTPSNHFFLGRPYNGGVATNSIKFRKGTTDENAFINDQGQDILEITDDGHVNMTKDNGNLDLSLSTSTTNDGGIFRQGIISMKAFSSVDKSLQFWNNSNDIFINNDRIFNFLNTNTNSVAYLRHNPGNTLLNFTGQHRCCPDNSMSVIKYGYIVNSTGKFCSSIVNPDGTASLLMGKDAIMVDESLPIVAYTTQNNDKSVFGVISSQEDNSAERTYEYGSIGFSLPKINGDNRLYINSLGEGAIWVANVGGNLENGDYITTCTLSGLGTKQTDDILHNYTVAKITMGCDFSGGDPLTQTDYQIKWVDVSGNDITEEDYIINGGYICAFVGCTYHCG